MAEVSIPFINSLVILDADGDRILVKYYDGRSKADQVKAEALLHKKAKTLSGRSDMTDIMLIDNELVAVRAAADFKIFISGPVDENDLIIVGVLDSIYITISAILRSMVDKRGLLDSLELILLTIDETIDHGYIMEMDSNAITTRVLMKSGESSTPAVQPATSIGDLTISQALGLAREQFLRSMG